MFRWGFSSVIDSCFAIHAGFPAGLMEVQKSLSDNSGVTSNLVAPFKSEILITGLFSKLQAMEAPMFLTNSMLCIKGGTVQFILAVR